MSPYRTPAGPPPPPPDDGEVPDDEHALAWLAFVLGGVRVAIAVAAGQVWGAEATLAGLVMLGAAVHLVRRALAAR